MSAERVLIVRVGAMGDVLHALPAVAALRELRPAWEIDWVVDPRWAPLLVDEQGAGPVVSRVHLAETRLWSSAPFSGETRRSVLSLRRALREGGYSAVVDLQGTLRSAVIGRFAGSGRLVGFADPRESAARVFYSLRCARRGMHVVEQNAALAGEALLGETLGQPLRPAAARLPVSAAAEAWAESTMATVAPGGRFALLAPSAGWGAKQWPAVRFGALAQALADRGFEVLVNTATGTAGERDAIARAVVEASGGAARLLPASVAQLVAVTRRAAVVVGGDSGPVHLAAAFRVPLVALFGPTDPARNGPWGTGPMRVLRDPGSRTSYKRLAETEPGLANLAVDEVLEAALAVFSGS